AGRHLPDPALGAAIGDLLVAAQRLVLGDPRGIVGGVAIGGAARADDDLADPGGDAGLEHVARAEHVDRVLELARAAGPRGHDRRVVHDRVSAAHVLAVPRRADGLCDAYLCWPPTVRTA